MKKVLSLLGFVVCAYGVGLCQGAPPITFTEVDGSPRKTAPTKIIVSNGTLTCVGSTCTLTTGGGGGGSPGGSNTQLQYNNSSSFGGISGATSDGTNVTFGSANLRATSPRLTTGVSDSNGNGMFTFTATGSAVNGFGFTNAAANGSPTFTTVGNDTDINLTFTPKGAGLNVFTKNILMNTSGGALANLFYVNSTSSGSVDSSFGFFVAGSGSTQASDGPYFLGRGNSYSGSGGTQRGMMFFVAGAPSSPTGSEGSIRFFTGNPETERMQVTRDGEVLLIGKTFSNLGTPAAGSMVFCSDCSQGDPCTGSGTGRLAIRANSRWYCP